MRVDSSSIICEHWIITALKSICLFICAGLLMMPVAHADSVDKTPIRIGVIAPASTEVGKGIINSTKLAAHEINAAGGVDGRPIKLFVYDDQLSASVGVRDFQRLVHQKKVVAVIGLYASEVALAVEPWAARLKTPLLIADAGSPEMTKKIHNNYAQYKYVFTLLANSINDARAVCAFTKHTLIHGLGVKTAVMLSEDAKWTRPFDKELTKCLQQAGLVIPDQIRFSLDTNDFRPLLSRIKSHNPDLIVTGLAHSGLTATVQWSQQRIPALMVGMNVMAQSPGFWKKSNGTANGVITLAGPLPGVALTAKTKPYMKAYAKTFGETVSPSAGIVAYDGLHILRDAIQRANSTDADALVAALEKTDYVGAGSVGRIRFRGRDDRFTHQATYHWTLIQWQDGKRVPVWPPKIAEPVKMPSFINIGNNRAGNSQN